MVILLILFMALRKAVCVYDRVFCKFCSIKKLNDIIHQNLFWNSTLKFVMEGYLALTLESLTLLSKGLSWSNGLNKKENLFAIVIMIVCAFAPLRMTYFFTKNFTQFRDRKFLHRFSSIVVEFNWRNKWSSIFICIFCYRRLILSLLIVFLPSYPYAQIQIMTYSCVCVVIFYGHSNVYRMKKQTILEFFNETTIMLCCYHMFCLTDFVDDPKMRYYTGYSLIAFTSLNLIINTLVMFIETVKNLFRKSKIFRRRCRDKKHIKKIKQRK